MQSTNDRRLMCRYVLALYRQVDKLLFRSLLGLVGVSRLILIVEEEGLDKSVGLGAGESVRAVTNRHLV